MGQSNDFNSTENLEADKRKGMKKCTHWWPMKILKTSYANDGPGYLGIKKEIIKIDK